MVALIVGAILIAFAIFAGGVPGPLGWWADVINFLKGSLPVLAAFTALSPCSSGSRISRTAWRPREKRRRRPSRPPPRKKTERDIRSVRIAIDTVSHIWEYSARTFHLKAKV